MADDYEYFQNKRVDRVYLSRSLDKKIPTVEDDGSISEMSRPFRIVSKVIDPEESHKFFKDGKQVSLRITSGGRQEIIAKFYEDSRSVFTLQIQRYTVESGSPHNTYFSFSGAEISVLYNFIRNVALLPLESESSAKLEDDFVKEIVLSSEQLAELLDSQPELLAELAKSKATAMDLALLSHRKKELEKFRNLLNDEDFFEECRLELDGNKGKEDVWQNFFEENTWIFGYGLCYQINSPLEGKKLEQVVKGFDYNSAGKRIDALLKTKGLINSLAFGEVKLHSAPLMRQVKDSYRSESWQISPELSGGIAQVQRTVQSSLTNLKTRTDTKDQTGNPTGERLFLYQPRSFLVIGTLGEFMTERGINEDKYSSFELFRRNITNPEIITFDELYQRAQYIVNAEGDGES